MKYRFLLLALLLTIVNVSTALTAPTMIPGKLYNLKDGTFIHCNLEFSTGQGIIEGSNPVTGEKFKGNYTAIFVSNIMGRGRGILIGDMGTVISLTLEFSKGTVWNLPVGYGDGTDNKEVKYQYQSNKK